MDIQSRLSTCTFLLPSLPGSSCRVCRFLFDFLSFVDRSHTHKLPTSNKNREIMSAQQHGEPRDFPPDLSFQAASCKSLLIFDLCYSLFPHCYKTTCSNEIATIQTGGSLSVSTLVKKLRRCLHRLSIMIDRRRSTVAASCQLSNRPTFPQYLLVPRTKP